MSPLAEAIYNILRGQIGKPDPRITYGELAENLRDASPAFEHVTARSCELYRALGEIGRACRSEHLPPMPALVVRADTRRPGEAYYEGRCFGMVYRGDRIAAWRRDLEAVSQAKYPRRRLTHARSTAAASPGTPL